MEGPLRTILMVGVFLIAGALLVLGYLGGGTVGLIITAALLFIVFLATSFFTTNYIRLNEMQVGVLFSRRGNFICFLDNDYYNGRLYPRPAGQQPYDDNTLPKKRAKPLNRHKINPAREVLKSTLSKGAIQASGTCAQVRTKEGIPITVPWQVSFRIEVLRILPGLEYKMARVLPDYAANLMTGRITQVIQHLVGRKTIKELYASTDANDGAIKRLEDEIRQELLQRTKAIGVTGIAPHNLKIGPIQLPAEIENGLRAAYQRTIHTEMVAEALGTLRQAISAFTQEDMDRLTELERLRIIDEKAKYMTINESFVNSRKEKKVRFTEEETASDNGNNATSE